MIKAEGPSMSSDPITYKEKVLGKRVEIVFEDDHGREEFYPGTIRKLRMELEEDETLFIEHYVEFDDGDNRWFDLRIEEQQDRLRWPLVKRELKREADAPAATPSVTPPKKQRTKPNKAVKKEEDKIPTASAGGDEDEDPSEDYSTHGVPVPVPDPLPGSITEIIHYMDELEPDEHYYARQADSRGECSRTRRKLRKFAKQNPGHPATEHWIETNKWQPPDEKTLNALIELIKTMIN